MGDLGSGLGEGPPVGPEKERSLSRSASTETAVDEEDLPVPHQLLADIRGRSGPEAQLSAINELHWYLYSIGRQTDCSKYTFGTGQRNLHVPLRAEGAPRFLPRWLEPEALPAVRHLAASPKAPPAARATALQLLSKLWDRQDLCPVHTGRDWLGELATPAVIRDLWRPPTAGEPETGRLLCRALDLY